MGDVVKGKFAGKDTPDVPVEKVLEGAIKSDLETVVVLGWRRDGKRLYASSSTARYTEIITLLEVVKKQVLDQYCE